MNIFDLIEKIKSEELSMTECIENLNNKTSWKILNATSPPGMLSIYLLKRILKFFPEPESKPKKISDIEVGLNKIIVNLHKKIALILLELNNEEIRGEEREQKNTETLFSDNGKFIRLKASPTFIDLFNESCEYFSQIKKYEIPRRMKGRTSEEKKTNRIKHVRDLVFYSRCFKFLFCDLFTSLSLQLNLSFVQIYIDKNDLKMLDLDKLVDFCENSMNFYLSIQKFIVKYSIPDIYVFMREYENRINFMEQSILEGFNRYVHLMWPIFEETFPEFKDPKNSKKIMDINSKEFSSFFLELIKKIQLYLLSFLSPDASLAQNCKLDIFSTLVFDKMISVYIEKYLDFKTWEDHFKCMDIGEFVDKYNNTNYPIIVRLTEVMYAVSYNDFMYFGDIIHVYIKYKKLLGSRFDNKIEVCDNSKDISSRRVYNMKDLLSFKGIKRRKKKKKET